MAKTTKEQTAKKHFSFKLLLIIIAILVIGYGFGMNYYKNITKTYYYTDNGKNIFSIEIPNKFDEVVFRGPNKNHPGDPIWDGYGFQIKCGFAESIIFPDCQYNNSQASIIKKGAKEFVDNIDDYKKQYPHEFKSTTFGNATAWKQDYGYVIFTNDYMISIPIESGTNDPAEKNKVWNTFHLDIAQ